MLGLLIHGAVLAINCTLLHYNMQKGVTREVIQVWFRAWPDHGAPELAEPFLNFVQAFRSATAELPVGPVIVNCR